MDQKTKTFEKYFLAEFKQTVFGVVLDKTSRVSDDSNYILTYTRNLGLIIARCWLIVWEKESILSYSSGSFLFGRGPNRVMETACFDAKVQ